MERVMPRVKNGRHGADTGGSRDRGPSHAGEGHGLARARARIRALTEVSPRGTHDLRRVQPPGEGP